MSLLAENLVEEWLNRKGYFTIRGVKSGVQEMDLLGIRRQEDGTVKGLHVEVQVSFRPVGYICKLTKKLAESGKLKRTSAKQRTSDEVAQCAVEWVREKFFAAEKVDARDKLWPKLDWAFWFVHGFVRDESELQAIQAQKVKIIPFNEVLMQLCHTGEYDFSGSTGGDLAEVIRYYSDNCPLDKYQ